MVTDVSTTWAEVIVRVKWKVVVSRMYLVRFVVTVGDFELNTNRTKYIRLTTTFHLTLMMTSAQVVETSVTTTDNSPSQDYTHLDDQTTLLPIDMLFLKPWINTWRGMERKICISFNVILVKFKFYLYSLLFSLYTQTFITYSLYCTIYKSMVLTRRICLMIKSFFGWHLISLFSWP